MRITYLVHLGRCGRNGREGMESGDLASSRVTVLASSH